MLKWTLSLALVAMLAGCSQAPQQTTNVCSCGGTGKPCDCQTCTCT